MSIADDLEKLQRLRETNALSEEEFRIAKARVLQGVSAPETLSLAGPDISTSSVDPRLVITIAIWATFACILIFGVFRMSWTGGEGICLFVVTVGGLAGLSYYGTKSRLGSATPGKSEKSRFPGEERDRQRSRDDQPSDDPQDDRFRPL